MRKHITIVQLPPPRGHNINFELQWLGNSLGLFGDRDKDKSCFRVFITLVKEGRRRPLSSDQIAEQLRLTRGTVVHHINHLMSTGMVERGRGGYSLKMESLQGVIAEMERDMEKMFAHLKRVSKDIDSGLGL